MKAASVSNIKKELQHLSKEELIEQLLRVVKYKKDNKELLSYLLFDASDEHAFIESIKEQIEMLFAEINADSFHYVKKSIRKILRLVKKNIKYSKKKETEVALLSYFCEILKDYRPSIKNNTSMENLYYRQITTIKKAISALHEDLQYDYNIELKKIEHL